MDRGAVIGIRTKSPRIHRDYLWNTRLNHTHARNLMDDSQERHLSFQSVGTYTYPKFTTLCSTNNILLHLLHSSQTPNPITKTLIFILK
jgi:hypothetical protein